MIQLGPRLLGCALFLFSAVGYASSPIILSQTGVKTFPSDYTPRLTRLPDGSVSWNQPRSTWRGYNGYCGQTAWANVMTTYTGRRYDPSTFSRYSFGDLTPGLTPATLTRGLNRSSRKNHGISWHLHRFDTENAWSNLKAALDSYFYGVNATPRPMNHLRQAPVVVLLQAERNTLHWVTVVRIEERDNLVYLNDEGFQRSITQSEFLRRWALDFKPSPIMTSLRRLPNIGHHVAILPQAAN